MREHYRIVCSECEAIIAQCRCPGGDKDTRYLRCDDCRAKETP